MAKRTNIRRRGSSWCAVFRVNGKQHWRSFPTREAAELYLAQAQAEKARGEFRTPERIRFRDFAEEWLRDYARGNVKPSTYVTYEGSLRNHLVPEFGELYLSQITRKAIDALIADWLAAGPRYQERLQQARELELAAAREERRAPRPIRLGRSAGTISNALTPFRKMLGDAVEWGYLTTNPAAGVKRPRVEREEMEVLSADEVRKLLDGVDEKGRPHVRPESRTLLLCAVATGMRRGEVLGLKWGDVDWNGRRVWVRRSVDSGGVVHSPKSKGSTRAIAMPTSLASALRLHRMASPFKDEGDFIFASSTGTPLEPRNVVRREFEPALRRAGLRRIRFHDLRHTFASLLIAQGEHPKLIAEQLGHASVQITLDRYGHLMPQSYDHAGERLEAALFGRSLEAVASTT
jgi:integrase